MDTAALQQLHNNADAASQLLKALSNPVRLLLLCQLVEAEHSVGELEEATGVRQPSLSQQLGVLRREGLIAPRRDGKQVHYRVADPRALAVLTTLYNIFCEEE